MSAAIEKKLDAILVLLDHIARGTKPKRGVAFTVEQLKELAFHAPVVAVDEPDADLPPSGGTDPRKFWSRRERR